MRSSLPKVWDSIEPPLSRGLSGPPLAGPRALYRQSLSALGPPAAENIPSAAGGHPDEEPMGALPFGVAERRQCLFHRFEPRLKLISGYVDHREVGLSRQNQGKIRHMESGSGSKTSKGQESRIRFDNGFPAC